jgi:hypothetical protein
LGGAPGAVHGVADLVEPVLEEVAVGVTVDRDEPIRLRSALAGRVASMSLPPRGPVPVSMSFRTRSGCLTIRSWAMKPPIEKEKMLIFSNPSALMNS